MNKNWIKFDGNNWRDVLIFLNDGTYIKRCERGEIISFIYISSLDSNAVLGDVIVFDTDGVKIFTEEEWKLFTLPPHVIEFERLLNILKNNIEPNAMIFDMINKISNNTLNIRMVFSKENCYEVNGCLCRIIENEETNLYEVLLYED